MSTGFEDLIKIAECDYQTCLTIEKCFPDEFAVRTATYHLQQAVEKILKAIILFYGEVPAFTHDITRLSEHCKKLGVGITQELEDISDTLTLWEAKSRYDPYINFSEKKYQKAKLSYNQLSEHLKTELQKYSSQENDIEI